MNPRYVVIAGVTLAAGAIVLSAGKRPGPPTVQPTEFTETVVTTRLSVPWEMLWGPDGMIWVSERGGRISRVDPTSGRRTTAGEVGGVHQSGEGGLMGMALHPDFPREPWVYVMHTYSSQTGTRNRLVRLKWDGTTLGSQQVLFEGLPGGGIHNGSRIVIGRDRMLYISAGDAGDAGTAQDSTSLGGKILRLDLNGKIPPDNPFHSAIWSWGRCAVCDRAWLR
jgi:aldose sugar dehydrogenase